MKIFRLVLIMLATFSISAVVYTRQQEPDCNLCCPQAVLYEDALVYVIKNTYSTLKTALLIVPKKHVDSLSDLDLDARANQQILTHLVAVAKLLASKLTGSQQYRLTINNGYDLQDFPHLCLQFDSECSLTTSRNT